MKTINKHLEYDPYITKQHKTNYVSIVLPILMFLSSMLLIVYGIWNMNNN